MTLLVVVTVALLSILAPIGTRFPLQSAVRAVSVTMAGATPEPGDAECTVTPRPFSEIAALADEPPGSLRQFQLGTPSAEIATPIPPTGGVPADPAVVEAVTAALHQIYACMNSGDMLRATALWTDDFLKLGLGGLDVEILAGLATPVTLPAVDRTTVVAVEDVRVLPDGRVTALARNEDGELAVHILVLEDGRYLLDGVYQVNDAGTPVNDAGTPVP